MVMSRFIWDVRHDSYLMEKDAGETTTAVYTNEPIHYGRLISQQRSGVPNYYHFDGQGSTCELTDTDEAVTDTARYSAFGQVVASSGTTVNPFTFTGSSGYYTDSETGTFYVRTRTYEPMLARWLSQDPLGYIEGPNLFQYVGSNPMNRVDPNGMGFWIIFIPAAVYAAWQAACWSIAIEKAEETFKDDKDKHCMASCIHNRCTLLITPFFTFGGGCLAELIGGWVPGDSGQDIRADAWGVVQSYGVLAKCKDLCAGTSESIGIK